MRFSIIIPVYNAESFLQSAVDSVLAQEIADYELLLVDDGSTDGSSALCDRLAAEYPQIRAVHQENRGQLSARLRGIEAAEGDYCVFLDADDRLSPDCLDVLNSAIGRLDAPDMLIYSFLYVSPNGERKKAAPLFETEREFNSDNKKELCEKFFTGTGLNNVWTKAVKRSVFDGTYPDYANYFFLRCGEDRLHSMGMADNAARIVYLPEYLYEYRLFPGSVTRQFSPEAAARFNTSVLYPCEAAYLKKWGLYSDDALLRLQAGYVAQTLYAFDLLYRNIKDKNERSRLVHYAWDSFVPSVCLQNYRTNPYLNGVQKRVFAMLLSADEKGLRRYFLKKNLYRTARNVKRKLIP